MTFPVTTVAVCDTEPISIRGLRALLDSSEDLRLVAEETSLMDANEAVRLLAPAVLIVDKSFGAHAVLDLIRRIREGSSVTRVLVWSGNAGEAESLRLLHAGASGVLRKTAPLELLLRCLRTVAAGATWMESDVVDDARSGRLGASSPLTARERQVMELVEQGLRNRDIADALGIRTGTVKIHLKHIFEKTGVHGRYGLALSGLKKKGLLATQLAEAV
jgi:DNA-binding NarL/FixJ family response regulator